MSIKARRASEQEWKASTGWLAQIWHNQGSKTEIWRGKGPSTFGSRPSPGFPRIRDRTSRPFPQRKVRFPLCLERKTLFSGPLLGVKAGCGCGFPEDAGKDSWGPGVTGRLLPGTLLDGLGRVRWTVNFTAIIPLQFATAPGLLAGCVLYTFFGSAAGRNTCSGSSLSSALSNSTVLAALPSAVSVVASIVSILALFLLTITYGYHLVSAMHTAAHTGDWTHQGVNAAWAPVRGAVSAAMIAAPGGLSILASFIQSKPGGLDRRRRRHRRIPRVHVGPVAGHPFFVRDSSHGPLLGHEGPGDRKPRRTGRAAHGGRREGNPDEYPDRRDRIPGAGKAVRRERSAGQRFPQ